MRRLGALVTLLLLVAVTLGLAAPDPVNLIGAVRRPQESVGVAGADHAVLTVAAVLAWGALLWLAVGVVLTLAGELPGLAGRVADALAAVVLPRLLRQGLALALGAGLAAGGPAGAWASPAAAPAEAPTTVAVALDWPMGTTGGRGADPTPTPAPDEPVVVVRTGDSLWRIAADRLGPAAGSAEIATAVQAWYDANSDVIGADPDLIRPGQQLLPPNPGDPR